MPSVACAALERRNSLVESHLNLVDAIARQVQSRLPPCFDFDDLRSAGILGLIDAADRFDPGRLKYGDEAKMFAAYARQRVRGAILDSVSRRRYRDATYEPLDQAAGKTDDRHTLERDIARKETAQVICHAIDQLPDRELALVEDYYRGGDSMEQAGRKLGVSGGRASQIHAVAIRKLRRLLNPLKSDLAA